jgi:hypothetical protein
LILAIYAASVGTALLCQLRSVLKMPFLARLSPRRGYQVPPSRPAAQRNRSSTNHRVQGETNAKNGAIRVLSLHYFGVCTLAGRRRRTHWLVGLTLTRRPGIWGASPVLLSPVAGAWTHQHTFSILGIGTKPVHQVRAVFKMANPVYCIAGGLAVSTLQKPFRRSPCQWVVRGYM